MTKYRICTEDLNRDGIRAILDRYFEGYTLIPGFGCWRGKQEASLTIEVVPPDFANGIGTEHYPALFRVLADQIKRLNHQESVMVETQEVEVEFV